MPKPIFMKKMLYTSIRWSFLVLVFCCTHQFAWADTEPNDIIDDANSLALNIDHNGTLFTNPASDANDWYSISVPADGNITVSGSYAPGLNGYIYIYGGNEAQLTFVYAAGTDFSATVNCIGSGTIYIRINRTSGAGEYNLTATSEAPINELDPEPNNSIAEIQETFNEGEIWSGHLGYSHDGIIENIDYYNIVSPHDGNVTLEATFDTGLSGYIYLYEKDGTQIGFVFLAGQTNSITANCYAGDSLIARISRTSGCGSYTASFSTSDPPYENDTEPNHGINIETSFEAIQDTHIEFEEWGGHLGYHDVDLGTDNDDYYYIISPRDGNVELTATYDAGLSGYIYLYEKDGTQIGFTYIPGTTGTFIANCYASDTLVARINRTSGCGTYTTSFTTPDNLLTPDLEPNHGANVLLSFEQIQETFQENDEWEGHLGYLDVDLGTDQDDYYYIISPRDGNVELNATYTPGLSGYIYLYEKDGTQIGFTYIPGTDGTTIANCYAGDTLIARINRTSGCGSYTTTFNTPDNLLTPDLEPNHAANVPLSISAIQDTFEENDEWEGHLGYLDVDLGTDSDDYYYIVSPRDGAVTLQATYDPGLTGYIYLYEKDGTQIGFTYIVGGTETLTIQCYASDTLVARINRTGGCGSYIATFWTSTLPYNNDAEPNNSIETAIPSLNYENNQGHLGYIDADTSIDSDDYYEISVAEVPFDLEAKLTKSTVFPGYLYLYNGAGSQMGFVYHGGLLETAYVAEITEAGTYYLRVNRTGGCGSYLLGDFCGSPPEVSASAGGPTIICPGESVLLSATEGLNAYSWLFDGNEVGTNQSLLATEAGTYQVIGYNTNGCDGLSENIEVTFLIDSDDDGICDVDDNCPNTPGLIGDDCDDGDETTENDTLDDFCQCIGVPIPSEVEGSVDWDSDCGDRDVEITIYTPGTNNLIATYSSLLSSVGSFDIEEIEIGNFDIYLKVEGFLATSIASVEFTPGLNNLDFGSIQPGDLNGDNGVNIIDVSVVNGAFGSSVGDGNFNHLADMNCDGGVNIIDVSILNGGFGMTGAHPTGP